MAQSAATTDLPQGGVLEPPGLTEVLDTAPDAIWVLDRDGKVLRANATLLQLVGKPAEEVIGKQCREIFSGSKCGTAECPLLRMLDGVGTIEGEIEKLRRDGTTVPCLQVARVRRDPSGEIAGMIEYFRDITDRKHREIELVQVQKRIPSLGEIAADIVRSRALSEILQATIDKARLLSNADIGVISQVRADGEMGTPLHSGFALDRIPPGSRPMGRGMLRRVIQGDTIFTDDVRGLPSFGAFPVWHPSVRACIGMPITHGGQVHAVLLVGRFLDRPPFTQADLEVVRTLSHLSAIAVGTSIQMEALAEAQRDAETANRVKTEFLANMSHEIRTPMNGILGMSEVLAETELSDEQREIVSVIQSSGEVLLTLLDDILDLSKIEAGRVELEEIDFELIEAVEDTLSLLGTRARKKGIELACWIATGVPSSVRGDPARFRQVLSNLLGNAIKFTETGHVMLRVTSEPVPAGGWTVICTVSDTGIGIPPERITRIFDPFTQADPSTTRKYGGTGLGLAIARHLATLMGGGIEAQSEAGKGSTFRFTARLRASDLPQAKPAQRLQGVAVLVVDDHVHYLEALEETLRLEGATVRSFTAPDLALDLLRTDAQSTASLDLLIADVALPGMDGFELVRRARAYGWHRPAMLLSSTSAPGERRQANDVGCQSYLTKPVRRERLIEAAEALVRRGESPPASMASTPMQVSKLAARVLVVEDNPVNQEVALRALAARGHEVVLAPDGKQALDVLATRGPFDLVLMDVQMPVMDGYEAARRIRANPDWASLPVVALTAHAMAADRERCLEAGMDDFVTKPLRSDEIVRVLAQWTGREGPQAGTPLPDWDKAALLEVVDNSQELLVEICEILLADFPRQTALLRERIAQEDWPGVRRQAHTMKGAAANVGGRLVRELMAQIEEAAGREDRARVVAYLEQLSAAWERLEQLLRRAVAESKGR